MTNPTPGGGGQRSPADAQQLRDEFIESLSGFVGQNSLTVFVVELDELLRAYAAAEQRRVRAMLASEGHYTCVDCVAEAIEEAGDD